MSSPIVGALFFGMVSAGHGHALPIKPFFAQGMPTPQCVQCGPANRRGIAGLQDRSNPRARAPYAREVGSRANPLPIGHRLGMTQQQAQRLTAFAGV